MDADVSQLGVAPLLVMGRVFKDPPMCVSIREGAVAFVHSQLVVVGYYTEIRIGIVFLGDFDGFNADEVIGLLILEISCVCRSSCL